LNPDDVQPSAEQTIAGCAGAAALLPCPTDKLTPELIAGLPDSIKIIATFSVGYDHINLPAAKERGIIVTNTPGVLTDATADIAMLLMLGAARRAGEGEHLMRTRSWAGWAPTHMMGQHVSGKAVGIVGMGRIGQAFADRCRAFGMTIHYHSRSPKAEEDAKGAHYHGDLEEMLGQVDVLSLHCPSTAETRKLLNAERLAKLPPHAIVVNTARGDVVDDDALVQALKDGVIAGAGLDVYTGEPKVHAGYADLANTFLLPHLGSATIETRNAMGFKALDNLDDYFAGRPPRDRLV
ncbi:MAG: D-glycerate dehydrogenase, partial [Alphaproteobacteria bacterium]